MTDLILDTNILADVIGQYFNGAAPARDHFLSEGLINPNLAREINNIEIEPSNVPLNLQSRQPNLTIQQTDVGIEHQDHSSARLN